MILNLAIMIRSIFFLLSMMLAVVSFAQVTSDPEFPVETAPATIYFNAEGTPLESYPGVLYTHTGVLLEGGTQWEHVIGDWGNNAIQPQLTRLDATHYKLEITPDIRTFYSVADDEKVVSLAFVFRSSTGSPQSSDLFINVFSDELSVLITTPGQEEVIVLLNQQLLVEAASPGADLLEVFLGQQKIYESDESPISIMIDVDDVADPWDEKMIIVKASNEKGSAYDSVKMTAIPLPEVAEPPFSLTDGVTIIDSTTAGLVLYAPGKDFAFALGDFNQWNINPESYMYKSTDEERFWILLENLDPNTQYGYQYDVNGEVRIADPYTEMVLDPWNDAYISDETFPDLKPYPSAYTEHIVSVLQTQQDEYQWITIEFDRPEPKDLMIYELLIRDFTEERNIQGVIDNFDYLLGLGVNAIELMPVNEFEGNLSWGYNPSFYFAPDKFYGTKNKLKELIDLCHQNDIAVIIDMVLNHQFGQSSLVRLYWDEEARVPSSDNPWFNQYPMHPYNVGYDMNHESPQTKAFTKRVLQHWLDEYHVDGFRFDLSKGFTQTFSGDDVGFWGQYDASRIAIWNDYESFIHEIDEDAYIILEHFASNTEENALSMRQMLLWGNMNYAYSEAAKGFINASSNFSWIDFKARGWVNPHLVGYMESHDEQRLMYENIHYGNTSSSGYNLRDTTLALRRMELAAALFIPIAGPKMIWMFGERGYDYSIDFNGRTGVKPSRWDYYQDYRRKFLYDIYAALIHLKMEYKQVFNQIDYSVNLTGNIRTIRVNHPDLNVIIAGNFGLNAISTVLPFHDTGWWYDYISGDSLYVENTEDALSIDRGAYYVFTDTRLTSPGLHSGITTFTSGDNLDLAIFPNPVSDHLHIEFYLPQRQDIKLVVADVSGREVGLLLEGNVLSGLHEMTFNLHDLNLRPGSYVFYLYADNQILTNKIIVK